MENVEQYAISIAATQPTRGQKSEEKIKKE
jgi:hypothetical protein